MTGSAAAADAARRLWARIAGGAGIAVGVPASAERMFAELRRGLGRWIGAEGYRVLLGRALGSARAEHPALGGLSCLGGDEAATSAAVRAHGAGAVSVGLVALVSELIELLGCIIGEEMAVRLVEQSGVSSSRRVVGAERIGGRDG